MRTKLTERERQCLKLAADGFTNREIGAQLGLSVETIKDHLQFARFRLGARNSTHAAVKATRMRLL